MRKCLPLALVFVMIFGMSLHAQGLKGSVMIDGNLTLSRINSPSNVNQVTTSFGMSPGVGYFVTDNLVAGIGLAYHQSKTFMQASSPVSGQPDIIYNSVVHSRLSPMLYVRHLTRLHDILYFSAKASLSYGMQGVQVFNSDGRSSSGSRFDSMNGTRVASLTVSPELLCFLTKRVGLQANFNGFNVSSYKQATAVHERRYTDYSFNLNPANWQFGVFVMLGQQ